ncbi:ClbS/DfsB family four-helix bundle protein [Acholeplasma laidlawii]|uniref:ClbS/DfsB family four-helix bundle protein n=1 Tax=Acholeplasma laidlawii TaxID=2148 RepID=UPI0021F71EA2|nr:ClbS/DfsB family four-helix bundle protein [Acholeplasma laidlawii]
MGRASTKQDLIKSANENYSKLISLLDSFSKEEISAEFTFSIDGRKEAHWQRDKNIRDVVIHLYEWQQLLLNWVNANMKGINQTFLPNPYNWKSYGDMNVMFWHKHQSTSYGDALDLLKESHSHVMLMIDKFSNDDLFARGYLKWTGGSTLGSYCVSATASHYEWAIKKIKLHSKK